MTTNGWMETPSPRVTSRPMTAVGWTPGAKRMGSGRELREQSGEGERGVLDANGDGGNLLAEIERDERGGGAGGLELREVAGVAEEGDLPLARVGDGGGAGDLLRTVGRQSKLAAHEGGQFLNGNLHVGRLLLLRRRGGRLAGAAGAAGAAAVSGFLALVGVERLDHVVGEFVGLL